MPRKKQTAEPPRMITVPIIGHYTFQDGVMTDEHYDYATIPAQTFVDFLLERFGIDPEKLTGTAGA